MPLPLVLRGRRRPIITLVIFVGVVLLLTSRQSDYYKSLVRARSESVRLERYMNYPGSATAIKPLKSSFDWSKVPYKFPPSPPRTPSTAAAAAADPIGDLKRDGSVVPSSSATRGPRVQHEFLPESAAAARERESRRAEVRKEFERGWAAYRTYAWKKDALLPISGGAKDQFSGWAATLVDALDTLWIMGLRREFDEAVAAVAELDFGRSSSDRVNTFETNIRYLGGLLAAYDLSGRAALLTKAVELGDFLYGAFNTPNHMPVDFIDFAKSKTGEALEVELTVVSASPGTLSLEMAHLSQVTGDPKYQEAMTRVMKLFHEGQSKTRLPGMWPMHVSMSDGNVVAGDTFLLGGGADSLYEYLPKMVALLPLEENAMYAEMSRAFMRTADQNLFFRPMLPDGADVLLSGNVHADLAGRTSLDPESEHLTCFIGGVFGLAGRLLESPADVATGGRLTRGCVHAYRSMASGMGPERWNTVPCASRKNCPWVEARWDEEKAKRAEWRPHLPRGYTTAKDPRYILRPEAVESVFVMHRVTGDPWYLNAAWDMFRAIRNGTRTELANAAVLDVTQAGELSKEDYMESFWFSETLKYFYLVFSPPDLISLDEFVFNTEAHPFRQTR